MLIVARLCATFCWTCLRAVKRQPLLRSDSESECEDSKKKTAKEVARRTASPIQVDGHDVKICRPEVFVDQQSPGGKPRGMGRKAWRLLRQKEARAMARIAEDASTKTMLKEGAAESAAKQAVEACSVSGVTSLEGLTVKLQTVVRDDAPSSDGRKTCTVNQRWVVGGKRVCLKKEVRAGGNSDDGCQSKDCAFAVSEVSGGGICMSKPRVKDEAEAGGFEAGAARVKVQAEAVADVQKMQVAEAESLGHRQDVARHGGNTMLGQQPGHTGGNPGPASELSTVKTESRTLALERQFRLFDRNNDSNIELNELEEVLSDDVKRGKGEMQRRPPVPILPAVVQS
uniref:EF-hand domain-containing protein n=1 Tax=Hemiselmis andersenii TaxID=464988 RepID=A0A7S1GUN9_HEMAN